MTHPYLLPGIKFNMNGNKDAYFVEGWRSPRPTTRPSRTGSSQGDVIDLSGKSTPCAWDQATGTCG